MVNVRTLARAFSGGELTPEFYGRIEDAKYQTGLATCRNFVPLPHGPAANRAGFAFVRATKNHALRSVVRPFAYSTTQTMVLEFGNQYLRFHTQGATLLPGTVAAYDSLTAYTVGDLATSGGGTYYCKADVTGTAPPDAAYWYLLPGTGELEIPTPYLESDVADIHYVQSADVLTLVHPSYPVKELRRLGATKWVLSNVTFASSLTAPTGVGAVATVTGTGLKAQSYVVTALGGLAQDESLPSSSATCNNNLSAVGAYNTVSWSAVTGAIRYNVYKLENGLYGFVGQTNGVSFVDDNIAPDLSQTPPENVNPFSSTNNYPAAVTYFEQRRCFGGTLTQPQNFWATRSGTENNLQYSIPTRDDDSIQFRIAAREANTIRHLVPLEDLVILTASALWKVDSVNTDALTPSSFRVKPRSRVGASNVQPVLTGNNMIYEAARGGHVQEVAYTNEGGGLRVADMSLRAPHLFDNLSLRDLALSQSPYPIVWAISSNGRLLGLTYVPEQAVTAWHRHDTGDGDVFESCCCVAEGAEDVLYVIVKRTIDGQTKRYVERLASRQFTALEDAFFVDSGLSYSGAPVSSVSGLDHLEGRTVSILADGSVRPPQVVSGGAVALDADASTIHVGLPIEADLKTLPLAFEAQAFGQGRQKNVNAVWLRVYQSLGIFAGPSFDTLKEAKIRTTEPFGSPPNMKTGEVEIRVTGTWADTGEVCVRQSDPVPLTVVAMTLEAAIGG